MAQTLSSKRKSALKKITTLVNSDSGFKKEEASDFLFDMKFSDSKEEQELERTILETLIRIGTPTDNQVAAAKRLQEFEH